MDVLKHEKDHIAEKYRISHDLRKANLAGANLEGANLRGANLAGANLRGANLEGTHSLEQVEIELASGDETTKLPEGLTYPASWIPKRDSPNELSEWAE